ncbi:MAG: VanZ family protein [Proteobacteria bacterium]|nr:VanZ family protein [Pseudomonadota bacterium]
MKLSRTTIHTFRFLLFITLIVVTFLATSSLEFTIVPSTYDKLNHFVAFFVLALLMDFSFPGSSFNVIKVVFLVSYGFSLEIIQHLLPHRMFSLFDIVADIVGLVAYGMFIPVFKNIPLLNHRWAS